MNDLRWVEVITNADANRGSAPHMQSWHKQTPAWDRVSRWKRVVARATVQIGVLTALGLVAPGPTQAVANGKHRRGHKVAVGDHKGSDGHKAKDSDGGGKDAGSDGARKHRDSDEGGNHGNLDGGDRDGPKLQADIRKTRAGDDKHERGTVKHQTRAAKNQTSAVREVTRSAGRQVSGKGSVTRDRATAASPEVTTTAGRAVQDLGTTQPTAKRLSSPHRPSTTAIPAGKRVGASVGAARDEILSRAEPAARQLTSTVTSAVDVIRTRVEAARRPVTLILESNGIAVTDRLLARPGAAVDAVSSPGMAGPSTAAPSVSRIQADAPAQWTAHDPSVAAAGAAPVAGAAASASNRLGSTESYDMGAARPWIGLARSNGFAAALPGGWRPPPRAPPASLPMSTVGLVLTVLLSIAAATLFAASLAAPRLKREPLLLSAHGRPLLFVSALERPG